MADGEVQVFSGGGGDGPDGPSGGVLSERVSHLANAVYQEFSSVVASHGEGPVRRLMPVVINILESLDSSLADLSLTQTALEDATEDNEQLQAQFEKEKQLRRDEQIRHMRAEDQAEEDRRDLRHQMDKFRQQTRQQEGQIQAQRERADKSEERLDKLKGEHSELSMKYLRISRAYEQQQQQQQQQQLRPRTTSIRSRSGSLVGPDSTAGGRADSPQSVVAESLPEVETATRYRSASGGSAVVATATTPTSLKATLCRPSSMAETMEVTAALLTQNNAAQEEPRDLATALSSSLPTQEARGSPDWEGRSIVEEKENEDNVAGDHEGGEKVDNEHQRLLQEEDPSGLGLEEIDNLICPGESLMSELQFSDTLPVSPEPSLNGTEVDQAADAMADLTVTDVTQHEEALTELGESGLYVRNDADPSTDFKFDPVELVARAAEMERQRDQLETERDNLVSRLQETSNDNELLNSRVTSGEEERQNLRKKLLSKEGELQSLQQKLEEAEKKVQEKSDEVLFPGSDDDFRVIGGGQKFTRVEMARVLLERNEFKMKYLSTKEKLQALEARLEVQGPKKREKTSLWKMFAAMFAGKKTSPSSTRRSSRADKSSMSSDKDTDKSKLKTASVSNGTVSLVFSQNRFEAYGWSLPKKMAPSSGGNSPLFGPQSKGLDTVPVLMHCGHIYADQDQTVFSPMRAWCAAAVCSTVQSNPSLNPSDTICPSSLVWVCTGTSELSKTYVMDTNQPGEVLDSFPVCSSPILCIASVPGIEDGLAVHIANATDNFSLLTTEQIESYRYHSPTGDPLMNSEHFSDDQDKSKKKKNEKKVGESTAVSGEMLARPRLRLPTMWMGAEFGCLYVHSSISMWRSCLHAMKVDASVLSIVYAERKVFVGMSNSGMSIFHRSPNGDWDWENFRTLFFGESRDVPISVMASVKHCLWCGVGNELHILDASKEEIIKTLVVHPSVRSRVTNIVTQGDGVWVSVRLDSTLRLYHADTFEHLQDIDVTQPIQTLLTFPGSQRKPSPRNLVRIASILISNNCLWIGSNNGVIISLPLVNEAPTTGISDDIFETPLKSIPSIDAGDSTVGEDVAMAGGDSCAEALAEAASSNVPYCSVDSSRLSFHGHHHAVDVLVACPGVMATKTVKMGDSAPKRVNSAAVTFVMSVGGGYVDFRSDSSTPAGPKGVKYTDRNHIIVWQVSPNMT